ncbi:unnamed protein product, partial [Laminaria digitata]
AGWQHSGPQQGGGSLVRHLSSDTRLPCPEGEHARSTRVGQQQQHHQQQHRQYQQKQGAELMPGQRRPTPTPHQYGGPSMNPSPLPRRERGYTISDSRSASASSCMMAASAGSSWRVPFDGDAAARGIDHHQQQEFGGRVRAFSCPSGVPPPLHHHHHPGSLSFPRVGGGGSG